MVHWSGISTTPQCLLTQHCHSICQCKQPTSYQHAGLCRAKPTDQALDGWHNVPDRTTYCSFNYTKLTSQAFSVSAALSCAHLCSLMICYQRLSSSLCSFPSHFTPDATPSLYTVQWKNVIKRNCSLVLISCPPAPILCHLSEDLQRQLNSVSLLLSVPADTGVVNISSEIKD